MSAIDVIDKLNAPMNILAIRMFENMIRERKALYNSEYLMSIIRVIISDVQSVAYNPTTVVVNGCKYVFNGECFNYEESDTLS